MAVTIKLRRDQSSAWTYYDPILNEAEIGLELDTLRFKFGNGVDRWADLPYANQGIDFARELSALSSQFIELTDELSGKFNDISTLQSQASALEIDVDQLLIDVPELSSIVNTLSAHTQRDLNQVSVNLSTLTDKEAQDVSGLKTDLYDLSAKVSSYTAPTAEIAFEVVSALTADVDTLKDEFANIENSITANIDFLSANIDTKTDEINVLIPQIDAKANKVHTHEISDVTNLRAELDKKAPLSLTAEVDAKANKVHTHEISDIVTLNDELKNKANAWHEHDTSAIIGLDDKLKDVVQKSEENYIPNGLKLHSDFSNPNITFIYDSSEPPVASEPTKIEISQSGITVFFQDGSSQYELVEGTDNQIARLKDLSASLNAVQGKNIKITHPIENGQDDTWRLDDLEIDHGAVFRLDKDDVGNYVTTRYPSIKEVSGLLGANLSSHLTDPTAHHELFETVSNYVSSSVDLHNRDLNAHDTLFKEVSDSINTIEQNFGQQLADTFNSLQALSSQTSALALSSENLETTLSGLSGYTVDNVSSTDAEIFDMSATISALSVIVDDVAERQIDQNEFRWVTVKEGISSEFDVDHPIPELPAQNPIESTLLIAGFGFVPSQFALTIYNTTAVSIKTIQITLGEFDSTSPFYQYRNREVLLVAFRKEGNIFFQNGKSINRERMDEVGKVYEFAFQGTVYENDEPSYFAFMTFDTDEQIFVPVKVVSIQDNIYFKLYNELNFENEIIPQVNFIETKITVNSVNDIADTLNETSSYTKSVNFRGAEGLDYRNTSLNTLVALNSKDYPIFPINLATVNTDPKAWEDLGIADQLEEYGKASASINTLGYSLNPYAEDNQNEIEEYENEIDVYKIFPVTGVVGTGEIGNELEKIIVGYKDFKPLATKQNLTVSADQYIRSFGLDSTKNKNFILSSENLNDKTSGGIYYVYGPHEENSIEDDSGTLNGRPTIVDGLMLVTNQPDSITQVYIAIQPRFDNLNKSAYKMIYIRRKDNENVEWSKWEKSGSEIGASAPNDWFNEKVEIIPYNP